MPLNRIDPELLISLVENRPLIWDKTTEDYKDKTKRNSAWREVCNVLRDNFEDMGEMEKQNYVKAVVKKWNQIRDSWTRSLKSLSASVNVKKYCYHNQLLFLKKVLDLPDIHDSALNRTHDGVLARTHDTAPAVSHNVAPAGSHDATRESVQLEMSNIEIKIEPDAEVPEPSVGEKRPAQENPLKLAKRFKKRLDPNQRVNHKTMPINNQVKTQNSSNEDRNLYFFKSLLPSLALLDEDQVLQFQAGVISLIQDIKSRRNEWSNQQPYPFHYLHQPSPSTSMQSSSHIDDGQLSPAEDTDYILKVTMTEEKPDIKKLEIEVGESSMSQLRPPDPSMQLKELKEEKKVFKFVSVNSEVLTDEQREMYESVLSTWKPVMFPKRTKQYICIKCNKEFKNYQNLYLHTTRVHSSEESAVMCDICDKTFKNKHYLYMHRMNKHYSEDEKCYCQFCLQEFRTSRALHMHVKRIHPNTLPELKCPECGKEFSVPYKLRYHIDACHRADQDKYKCHICQKLYKSHLNLNRHLHFQHSQVERHKCVFCDMTFKSRHHMKRHILNIHPPLESKVSCPECLKEFKNDQYLKEHMQVHSSLDTKVKCDLCDKFFHSAIRLKKHKKIVHPSKPKMRCEKCDKEFAHAHYLRRHNNSVHMEVDETKYEHECEQCGKKFKLKRYLSNHLQRHEQQHLKRISQMVKTVMTEDGREGEKPKKKPARPKREAIEFIKCEPVSSSDSESGETESDSE